MPKWAYLVVGLMFVASSRCPGQKLDAQLKKEGAKSLVSSALKEGDAQRGAILFYQPQFACVRCHTAGKDDKPLGPDLTKPAKGTDNTYLVDSILTPSKNILKGFETHVLVTKDGQVVTGRLGKETPKEVFLHNLQWINAPKRIAKKDIEERGIANASLMPDELVNLLASRQQFLDLVRYLIEIRNGGMARAEQLKPPAHLYAIRPLPEYEKRIDHAGMIADFDGKAHKRGEAIYQRLCINCHGTHDKAGSLPTSLRFAEGKFKNGSDPFTMYRTLTHGFGMMAPQTWMVPQQKYDVIHYIREAYLKKHNPSQYHQLDADYLASLPVGNTRGPAPNNFLAWTAMDYGPSLINTYEIGQDGSNFAYKGIAVRLDTGPGGVSRGRYWMILDHDTMRMAAAWTGTGFIDWNGIHFNGRHNIHPRIAGDVLVANPTGPGWADANGNFEDVRLVGRDGRRYGPLPRAWAKYKGLYSHGQKSIVAYSVGETDILESPSLDFVPQGTEKKPAASHPVLTRTFEIAPRQREMTMLVATHPGGMQLHEKRDGARWVTLGSDNASKPPTKNADPLRFDGETYLQVDKGSAFDFGEKDFSITARIKTKAGGTLFCKTAPEAKWVPNGKTFFVRGGRLAYDIGWVGVVQSNRRVNDGRWHDVAMTWEQKSGRVRMYIDGKPAGEGTLRPEASVKNHLVRIGFSAPNFPRPQSHFEGELGRVTFHQRLLDADELRDPKSDRLVAAWNLNDASGSSIVDASKKGHDAKVLRGEAPKPSTEGVVLAGLSPDIPGAKWSATAKGELRLTLPAGEEPLRFTLWMSKAKDAEQATSVVERLVLDTPQRDLTALTKGGPPRWPEVLTTKAKIDMGKGPFGVDVLTHPANNPWLCRVRLTGLDFYPNGKSAIVSAWDGDVWHVSNIDEPEKGLKWRRIASGLFQPLGVKIVDRRVFITCRDQLVILHDLNGDGETDFYESFNNDHQVTDHFHEFAMGLQVDDEGNFYYAKSARHALTALVPHHGTLLKISKDGSKTEILANGFRAANGVCLNPDGSFFVTDQEGHWTPKNRINWVQKGGFYGNMFGYHDNEDNADSAMEQPLCWITNKFDRSPAELLWIDSDAWGPLKGSLLEFSYGYGKVFIVPHEKLGGQMQGGLCALPIPLLPTGIMRGRFHKDGQLYSCGMFAWAGSAQQPGGFYRIRYTGKPVHLPIGLEAKREGMKLTFSAPLDAESVEAKNFAVRTWGLKRTKNYGSKHYDEKSLKLSGVTLSEDGREVFLRLPDIEPTWCMEIRYSIKGASGEPVSGVIHNTIHKLGK